MQLSPVKLDVRAPARTKHSGRSPRCVRHRRAIVNSFGWFSKRPDSEDQLCKQCFATQKLNRALKIKSRRNYREIEVTAPRRGSAIGHSPGQATAASPRNDTFQRDRAAEGIEDQNDRPASTSVHFAFRCRREKGSRFPEALNGWLPAVVRDLRHARSRALSKIQRATGICIASVRIKI